MEEFVKQWNGVLMKEWDNGISYMRNGDPSMPLNSRVRFIDGKVLYSPNSRRDVLPPPPQDPDKNLFLPEISRSSSDDYFYNFSKIGISLYTAPFWWTEKWGWAAFIPLHLNDTLYIFKSIQDPNPEIDYFMSFPADKSSTTKSAMNQSSTDSWSNLEARNPSTIKYTMNQSSADSWSDLEASLFRATHDLALLTKSNIVKPALPWVFGYKKYFSSRSRAAAAIRRSREWFGVWVGLLSYLIARAEKMFHDSRSSPSVAAIPEWRDYLFSLNYSPAWVHALATACTIHLGDSRVGVFVDLRQFSPSLISWLENCGVPVWYFLDLSQVSLPELAKIGPGYIIYPSDEDIMPRPQPLPLPESESVGGSTATTSTSKSPPTHCPLLWQEFFLRREERNKKIMQKESPEQRRSRQDREKNPPTTSAKVYIWVPDDSGTLVRELVCRRERADTLALYADDEIKYDSFSNEYDCCEDFGSGKGLSKQELIEAWEDDDENEIVEEVAASDLSKYPDVLSNQPTLSTDFGSDPADEWLPSHVTNKSAGDSLLAEEEILDILKLHFGYTSPLPALAVPSSFVNEADQKGFLRVIGIAYKTIPAGVFKSANIFAAVEFIRRLCQQNPLSGAEWDLNRDHPQSLAFNKRISNIQILPSSSPSSKLFMFDLGAHQTVTWKLAVSSASDAVMICRLDPDWDEVLISLFLVRNGIPFHTLQSVSIFPQSRPRNIQFPSRPPLYQFDKVDYSVYLEDAKQLLKGPRGRVALMMGGYIWRLAVSLVSFDTVFEGPSGLTSSFLRVETENGQKYFDDQLTGEEADILCGLHHCRTGQGDQIAKKSWYPLQQAYEGSGHDYRRWTSNSEAIFDIFNTRNLAAIHDEKKLTLQRQPLPANKWRDASRGSGDTRRSRQRLEKASLTLISAAAAGKQ